MNDDENVGQCDFFECLGMEHDLPRRDLRWGLGRLHEHNNSPEAEERRRRMADDLVDDFLVDESLQEELAFKSDCHMPKSTIAGKFASIQPSRPLRVGGSDGQSLVCVGRGKDSDTDDPS